MKLTCTSPGFFSFFLEGSMGIRLGLQCLVMGNLIFWLGICGRITLGAGALWLIEIKPGGRFLTAKLCRTEGEE